MTHSSRLIELLPPPPPNKTGWPWTQENSSSIKNLASDTYTYPKVTIVTPSYNQAEFLEETIRSVLLQGYDNLEYIIIDGGSTDNSIDIIRKYETWINYWISQPDNGQADAINKGFERATGEFLGWINSDDYLYPGAIAKMVTELEKNPDVSLVYGDVDQGSESNKLRLYGKSSTISDMLKTYRVPIPQPGSMWRFSVIEETGGLDTRWQVVLDREFFLRVAAKYNIAYIPNTVAFFRHHLNSKSISVSQTEQWLKEMPLMYDEFFENNYNYRLTRESRKLRKQAMGLMYIHCISIAFKKGKKSKSLIFFIKAIREYLMFLLFVVW